MDNIIKLSEVSKSYGDKEVLSEINLSIPKNKIIGLLGPNGSGKTTMIKLINSLITPSSGVIEIYGKPQGIETKKIISYLPDKTYLNDWMRVSDILKFFEDFYEDFDKTKADEMIKSLGIDKSQKLKTMSKGTKEKVQLILVMSRKAKVYILDEPIGGVDPAARSYILDTILKTYNQNSTLIIATHLIREIENICDEVIFLSKGKIVLNGDVKKIKQDTNKSIDELFREEFRC